MAQASASRHDAASTVTDPARRSTGRPSARIQDVGPEAPLLIAGGRAEVPVTTGGGHPEVPDRERAVDGRRHPSGGVLHADRPRAPRLDLAADLHQVLGQNRVR